MSTSRTRSRLLSHGRSALPQRSPVALAARLAGIGALAAFGAAQAQDAAPRSSATLGAVTVTAGQDTGGSTGALGERSIRDTPYTLTTVDSLQIEERQVKSVADAFFGDPSVTPLVNDDGVKWSSSGISVRGLSLSTGDSSKLDGLTIVTSFTEWPLETVERVDLLKGSGGFLYGFGAPGGIVNYVSKRPTDQPLRRVTAGLRSSGVGLAHVDLGGRVGEDERFGYRLNVVREEGRTYNGSTMDRSALALAVDARLTSDLTWDASWLWQDRMLKDANPSFSLGNGVTRAPRPVDGGQDFSVNGAFVGARTWGLRTGLQWRASPDWKASVVAGRTHYIQDVSFPFATVSNNAGDFTLNGYEMQNRVNSNVLQAMVEGKLQTGPFKHQVVAGAYVLNRLQDVPLRAGTSGCATGCRGNLGDAGIGFTYERSSQITGYYRYDASRHKALFLSDTIEFTPQWSLLAGLRYNDYTYGLYNAAGALTSQYGKKPTTPTVALLYKPIEGLTAYASYIESLEQGSTVGVGYLNTGDTLPAMVSKQYEAGVKYGAGRWSADAALFQIDRGANIDVVTPAGKLLVQDGVTRYRGLELSTGYRGTGWNLSGGLTHLDATYERLSPASAANQGKQASGVSKLQAVVQGGMDIPALPGLRVHAGLRYYGDYFNDAANTLKMPGYALAQAGLSYEQRIGTRTLTYRAEIKNLGDRRYWSAAGVGAPRTFAFNVTADL